MFPCQNGTKMRYKPKKLDIFEVKLKISIEYTRIKILLPLWHLLHSYKDIELKMNQICFKNGKKEKKNFATRVGFEPGTALGVLLIVEALLKNFGVIVTALLHR